MGLFKKNNRAQKNDNKVAEKELTERAQKFITAFKEIRTKYNCDFEAYLTFALDGIIPAFKIIDITGQAEEDKQNYKPKEELVEPIKPAQPSNPLGTPYYRG